MRTKRQIMLVWLLAAVSALAQDGNLRERAASRDRLKTGDFTVLDELQETGSLNTLYSMLLLALRHQFGERSDEVKEAASARIRLIPDHAKYLGDGIEALSADLDGERGRENKFYLLGNVASHEAIQEIGRFLLDERHPGADELRRSGVPTFSNAERAATAMGVAMPDRLQLKRKPGWHGPHEVKAWQDWWQSADAAEFRNPLPAPAPADHESADPVPEAPVAATPPDPSSPRGYLPWILGAVILLGISWYLAAKRR